MQDATEQRHAYSKPTNARHTDMHTASRTHMQMQGATQRSNGNDQQGHLVGSVNLKLNAHLTAGLVLASGRVNQRGILVVGVVLCHHHIQHHTWVGDLQVFPLLCLKLQCTMTPVRLLDVQVHVHQQLHHPKSAASNAV